MVEGMDSGSGAGMTRVTLLRLWKGPGRETLQGMVFPRLLNTAELRVG